MGLYDRDYYREKRGFTPFDGRVQACVALVVIYAVVFIVQAATRDVRGGRFPAGPSPITELLDLQPEKVLEGEVWRVLTYPFLHEPSAIFPVVLNCLFLIWFGRTLEERYGWKEFLSFYLLAGFLAGVAFVLLATMSGFDGALIGPACSITGTLFLFALHYPRQTILLFFVLPCPVWFVVVFYVLISVFGFGGGGLHPVVLGAHAVAAGFAFVYFRFSLRISNWLPGMPSGGERKRGPKLHIFRGEPGDEERLPATSGMPASSSLATAGLPQAAGGVSAGVGMDEHLEAKLDEVLEKVKKHGQESLSEDERAVLFRASEIYRKRRKLGGN